ncbi:DUF397 domain-containing protein [Kitasatospora acidiphila]|uniref:DUF397 domain-containing protein n=1 Tax=Kitasatospora acidiphila TaxID=2567942 RepID=A0A540WBC9_9ACTN|nr:DUF397 domain-containing protein [Kitasatospora acidiphila]TQF06340.1 DUF397 domain-containing protein [Kitasatospora acidiphila]
MSKPNPADLDFSDAVWEKSPFSDGGNDCVEFAAIGSFIAVRDSKNPEQAPLVYTRGEIRAMILGAKAGVFDHLV